MKHTTSSAEEELQAFVKKAKDAFHSNPGYATYTYGAVEPGCLFAVRWGGGHDCILVFRLHEDFEPTIYGQELDAKQSLRIREKLREIVEMKFE